MHVFARHIFENILLLRSAPVGNTFSKFFKTHVIDMSVGGWVLFFPGEIPYLLICFCALGYGSAIRARRPEQKLGH